jgi:hypothetical protein
MDERIVGFISKHYWDILYIAGLPLGLACNAIEKVYLWRQRCMYCGTRGGITCRKHWEEWMRAHYPGWQG